MLSCNSTLLRNEKLSHFKKFGYTVFVFKTNCVCFMLIAVFYNHISLMRYFYLPVMLYNHIFNVLNAFKNFFK